MSLRAVALTCHLVLGSALAFGIAAPTFSTARAVLAALALAPLLAALPGLVRHDRRVEQRLAVLLVAYIGGVSMEVVARAGADHAMNIGLLGAVLELGVLLALIRRARSPASRG
jgi:uncharacterized membrane protein